MKYYLLLISFCFFLSSFSQLIDTNFRSFKLLNDTENNPYSRFEDFKSSSRGRRIKKCDSLILVHVRIDSIFNEDAYVTPTRTSSTLTPHLITKLPQGTKVVNPGISLDDRIERNIDIHAICFRFLKPLQLGDTICFKWNILSGYSDNFKVSALLTDNLKIKKRWQGSSISNVKGWKDFIRVESTNAVSVGEDDIQVLKVQFVVTDKNCNSKWLILKPEHHSMSGWIWDVNYKPKLPTLEDSCNASFFDQKILFDYDDFEISDFNKNILANCVKKASNDSIIKIELFTSSDGHANYAYNKELSMKRATSVKEYLEREKLTNVSIQDSKVANDGDQNRYCIIRIHYCKK